VPFSARRLTADLRVRKVRRANVPAQERCAASDTSWNLLALWPSSASEPAFSFCIARMGGSARIMEAEGACMISAWVFTKSAIFG
jgi:hypothetical protein